MGETTTAPAEFKPSGTPLTWRLSIAVVLGAIVAAAYVFGDTLGTRFRAGCGLLVFFGLVAMFSSNLRKVNWRTIVWGIALQFALAMLVLKVELARQTVAKAGEVVTIFMGFCYKGSAFVFGNLYDPRPPNQGGTWSSLFGSNYLFQFAFVALPPILVFCALFTVLYHFGILQWMVRIFAKLMVYVMGTSGAETLSVAANVFMGQTEAPLIVRPYVPRMTNSELFTLMVSGFAHIAGALMAVYISYGADPVAVLTTCVMACPCSLYLSKLFLPETSTPETSGNVQLHREKSPYVNAIDAAATGTTDGLRLALNVAAMLIVFIAFVAMFDALLASIKPGLLMLGIADSYLAGWPDDLSLRMVFGWLFTPAAYLMGVDSKDVHEVASLLGAKLTINEHYAYLDMKTRLLPGKLLTRRSFTLTAFALTGFANFSSVGIQLGGIGTIAPERRHDLARLGGRALFVGFVATLLNASIAGILLDEVLPEE